MEIVMYLIGLAITGLIVGGLARLIMPGPEAIGLGGTMLAGIAGAFVGGLVGALLFGTVSPLGGWLLAIAGAALFIYPYRSYRLRQRPD